MPDVRFYDKDHLKDICIENKKLLKLIDIPEIKVPLYNELSMDKILPKLKEINSEVLNYLPQKFIKGDAKLNRSFFYAVFAAVDKELLLELIK